MVLCHYNARGLLNKEEVFKEWLVKKGVACAGVAESHTYRAHGLTDATWQWEPGKEEVPGPSQHRPPGGMGFFFRTNSKASIVETGDFSVWCRMETKTGRPIFVGECYFPHANEGKKRAEAWDEVGRVVEKLRHLGHIVLMGDFNAKMGMNGDHRTDTAGRVMRKRLADLRLHAVNGFGQCRGNFTREQVVEGRSVRSTIDYVCVSSSLAGCVEGMEIADERFGSDHKPLLLSLRGITSAWAQKAALREVWRVENIPHWKDVERRDRMAGEFQKEFKEWVTTAQALIKEREAAGVDSGAVADELEKSFQEKLDEAAKRLIGKKLVGPKSSPILSRELKELDKRRRGCEERLRKVMGGGASDGERRKVVAEYRRAKGEFFQAVGEKRRALEMRIFKQIEEQEADSKLFWANYKKIGRGMRKVVKPPPMAQEGDRVVTDPAEARAVWQRFAKGIATGTPAESEGYDEQHRRQVERRLGRLNSVRMHQAGLDDPITEEEVFRALRKMKMGKAPGLDGVASTILRTAADVVGTNSLKEENWTVQALTLMFNYVFRKETWPARWQSGIVVPIHKGGNRMDPGNYRPITLLSVVGKVFGSVVESRLSSWSEERLAMADEQGGFRRCRGTPDLLFAMKETLLVRKALNLPTLATFIDARKAYDTVWREGNFVKLHDMGVRGKMWRQLQAMSSNPRSRVRLPFGETEWIEVTRGVAQGAVESPWLYSCFVNGLAEELKERGLGITVGGILTPLLMYADDVVMLAGTVTELREMNAVASEYARRNRFQHNGDKSAVMLFNADAQLRRRVMEEEWVLSGKKVEVKGQYKYLGVEMLQSASWKEYAKKAINGAKRASSDLAWLVGREAGMRARSACTLWRALVRPKMEYAAELWGGELPAGQAAEMEKIQTDFCRSVLGLNGVRGVSNDFLRAELGMERMQSRWAKLRLGYWRRLLIASPERLLRRLTILRIVHAEQGGRIAQGWMVGTRKMLETCGLGQFWLDPAAVSRMAKEDWKKMVAEAVEGVEDKERERRLGAMSSEESGRYQRCKKWGRVTKEEAAFSGEKGRRGARVHERYLDDYRDGVGRKLKMLCRAGCLPVLDRVGRETGWPDTLRTCMLCGTEPETIQHLLVTCPAHARHRDSLVARVYEGAGGAWVDYESLSPNDQCDLLLGRSTGVAVLDDKIDRLVKRFVRKAWAGRGRVVEAVEVATGVEGALWELGRCKRWAGGKG